MTVLPGGPWVTTADEVPDPAARDEAVGQWRAAPAANTRDLVLDIPGMIETASAVMTLNRATLSPPARRRAWPPSSMVTRCASSITRLGEMTVDVVQGDLGRPRFSRSPMCRPSSSRIDHGGSEADLLEALYGAFASSTWRAAGTGNSRAVARAARNFQPHVWRYDEVKPILARAGGWSIPHRRSAAT
jgi:hypothetical protein